FDVCPRTYWEGPRALGRRENDCERGRETHSNGSESRYGRTRDNTLQIAYGWATVDLDGGETQIVGRQPLLSLSPVSGLPTTRHVSSFIKGYGVFKSLVHVLNRHASGTSLLGQRQRAALDAERVHLSILVRLCICTNTSAK